MGRCCGRFQKGRRDTGRTEQAKEFPIAVGTKDWRIDDAVAGEEEAGGCFPDLLDDTCLGGRIPDDSPSADFVASDLELGLDKGDHRGG